MFYARKDDFTRGAKTRLSDGGFRLRRSANPTCNGQCSTIGRVALPRDLNPTFESNIIS